MEKTIKKVIILFTGVLFMGIFSFWGHKASAASADNYVALDNSDPVEFFGTYIKYGGEKITLSEKCIYLDGSLSDDVVAKYDHVYNDFKKAATAFKSGTEAEPMKVYIAPYVYWIDDPDDETIRVAMGGDVPYGLVINCNYLQLIGLTKDPYNVVLAVNRGQTHGAKGNYTMFYFNGSNIRTENLTMGNYCNVDLEYSLKPELSRKKRAEAITQAQLALTNGDRIVATNCNFISRLNACPFVGSSGRVLFKDCHIECGDDALPGTAVYLDCDVEFHSSKPFYITSGTGAVFLNCKLTSMVKGTQYLTKAGGTVSIIDCEFLSDHAGFKVEWTPEPAANLKCIQSNVKLNGKQITIAEGNRKNTIDLTGTEAEKAFVITVGDKRIYNTYNLLKGTDGWDPLDNKAEIEKIDEVYLNYPYIMNASALTKSARTGTTGTLTYNFRYFRNVAGPEFKDSVTWEVDEAIKDYVKIEAAADGTCSYSVTNTGKKSVSGMIYVKSSLGYASGTYLTIMPKVLEAPEFKVQPSLEIGMTDNAGCVRIYYELDTDGEDISVIDWYRTDKDGKEKIRVATSRLDEPEYIYELTPGDIGYYIMAQVTPKELGSNSGSKVIAITNRAITLQDNPNMNISTDFQNFAVDIQNEIIPGFWTVGGYKPLDTAEYDWKAPTAFAWTYGEGDGGATGTGLLQAARGTRILYTPVCGKFGDMSVRLVVDPCKSAGQGFGSATAQYMDIYIKMDNENLNGYALRIERTNKFSNGVDFKLIKYVNGMTETITEPVSTSCYNSTCTIELSVKGNILTAHAETTHSQSEAQSAAGLVHVVDLSAEIETNNFGGSGVLHTGTAGANATMLHQMDIAWNEEQAVYDYEALKEYLPEEPEVTATPMPTATPTMAPTPIPTVTPEPTATATPEPALTVTLEPTTTQKPEITDKPEEQPVVNSGNNGAGISKTMGLMVAAVTAAFITGLGLMVFLKKKKR